MKNHLLMILFVLGCNFSKAANYYWIGGTGNWSDINHWATTSGGSILYSFVPSQNDNVFFDANSGFTTSSRIVTVNTNAVCNNMTWSGAVNTPTITGPSNMMSIYGSMTLQPGMLYNVYTTEFKSLTAGQTIVNGGSLGSGTGYFTFNGTGSWTLQDPVNAPSLRFTLTNGSLSTNNQNLTINSFSSAGSLTRALSLGTSTLTTKGVIGWGVSGTGITMNAGTSTIILDYNDANTIWNTFTAISGHNYYNVIFNQGGAFNGASGITFNSVTFLGNGEIRDNLTTNVLTLSANKKYKINNLKTVTVNSQFNANPGLCGGWISMTSSSPNNQGIVSMPAGATVNVSNLLVQDITASGGAVFTASNSVNEGNSSGWVFTAPAVNSLYWIGGTGDWNDGSHWSTTSGGPVSGCIPGPTTDVFFNAGSGLLAGVETVSISGVASCRNLNFSGTVAPAKLMSTGIYIGSLNIYGSIALQAGMTYSVLTNCKASSAATILSNGVQFNAPEPPSFPDPHITFNGTGSWTLSDAFDVAGKVELTRGTLNTNNQAASMYELTSSGNFTKSLNLGSSVVNLFGPRWLYPNGLLNAGTSHLIFNTTGSQLFSGSSQTFYDVTFINQGELITNTNRNFHDVLFLKDGIVSGQNRFNTLSFSPNAVYKFSPLYTNTVTGQFNAYSPACGGWIRMDSYTPGTQALINIPATGTASVSNVLMQDIGATGGATFNALNSSDNGNNSGWMFGAVTFKNLYWVGGSGNWNDPNHWSTVNNGIYPSTNPCVPGPGDDVFFNANSGLTASSRTVTISTAAYCHNITCAGSPAAPAIAGTLNLSSLEIYGSAVMQSGGTFTGLVSFKSSNAETITSNGVIFTTVSGAGAYSDYFGLDGTGSWTLMDNLNVAKLIYLKQGTFTTNNYTLTCAFLNDKMPTAATNTVGVRQLNLGGSLVNVTSGYSSWYYSQVNSSLNAGTSHINLTSSGEFLGKPGHVYHDVTFRGSGSATYRISGTGFNFNDVVCLTNMEIFGNHVYNTLTFSGGKTYKMESASTQSVTTAFYPSGNPCFINYISSLTPGSRANLNVQAGNVNYDFISIADIDANPSYSTLQMAGHSTNAGNNVNITFAPTTTVGLAGLGPDITRCQYDLPVTLNTINFYPNPATTYTWTGGSSTSSLVVNAGGTYSVTVNYGAGCTVGDAIVITANPTPTLAITGNTVICSGAATTLMAGGAGTYTWTSLGVNTNTVQLSPPSNTSYSIVGTSTAGCVSNPAVVSISVNATPTIAITSVSSSSVCSGNTSTITPGGASSYTLQPGNSTGTSFTVNPSVSTTYTISGVSTANCPSQNSTQQLITVAASPTVNIASVSSPSVCSGNTAVITPAGASTYTLLPGNSTGTSFTVNPSVNTTYTISGMSTANCPSQNSTQQLITVSASPTVNIASVSSPSACSGNPVVITPGGASTYTLLPGNISGTSFTVNPSTNTTYTITGTSASNCPSQNSVQQTITMAVTPTVNIASVSSPSVCAGNPAVITPGGATTYTLQPGNMSGTSFTVNPNTNTTYTITGTSAANCPSQNSTQQLISVATSPTVNIASVSSPSVCAGNTAVITPGGASTYTLLPGNNTGTSFTVNPSGNTSYTISGSSASNCPSQNSVQQLITVGSNPVLTVSSLNHVSCFGLANGSVVLTSSGGAGSGYAISPTTTTNLSPGNYTYTLTDANNCVNTVTVSVTQPTAALTAAVSNTTANTSCTNSNGTASVSINGGTPSYTVSWDNGSTGTSVTNLNSGVHTYTVVDARACIQNTGSVNIPGVTGINATVVSQSSISCFGGTTGALTYTTTGGSSYTYTIVTATTSQTNTTGSFTNLAASTYTVYVSETSSGCTDTDVITLTSPSSSVAAAVTAGTILCYGNTTTVSATVNGGTPGYQYSWSSNPSVLATATYTAGTYSLTVTDANNCVAGVQVFTISQPATALTALVTTTNNISCINPGGAAILTPGGGTGATTVLWSAGNAVNSFTNTGLASGPVSYTVTDANGCMLSGVVTINGIAMLAVSSVDIDDATCPGENTGALDITITGGTPVYTYSWSNTGANVASQSGLAAGVYVVTVTDIGNCSITRTLTVAEPTPLMATIISVSASCPDSPTGAAEISVGGGTPSYSVLWANGQSGGSVNGVPTGTLIANITDSRNCRMSYSITIPEKSCKEIFVPEMFTPNGDGKNDKFVITKIEEYPNNHLHIFNRWGSAVYTKDGYNNEFDGSPNVGNTMGNGLLPSGTYYVVLDFGDDKTKTYTGYIELQY